jgi:uncharacterized protein (TIGR03083 family)
VPRVTVPGMERAAYLDAIRRDGEALAGAAEGNLSTPVASCPGWTVADLVFHVSEVHRFWTEVAERRLQSPDELTEPARPGDDELIAWYRAGLGHLLAVLEATDPATKVWTWAPQQDVGFIVRRMAHETAVHGWDARAAAGDTVPLEAEQASDGVDEFLAYFTAARRPGAAPLGGSVHLHCTDVAGEWIVRDGADGRLSLARQHAKGDAAVRGTASDLILLLWRRVPLDAVEVIGDRSVAERLIARQRNE